MEAMEVDSPSDVQAAGDELYILDYGSNTEVEEDDNDEGQMSARVPPRLPSTWAFSQRVTSSSTATNSSTQRAPIRRRLR